MLALCARQSVRSPPGVTPAEDIKPFAVSWGAQDELAQQTLHAMCRKFGGSAKVWLRAYTYALAKGDSGEAKKTLDKAVASLPARKHIKVGS
jgi:glycine cleavage system protein P-like pyridoxal-binding family